MPQRPIKRVETGFGHQWQRLKRAFAEKDSESLRQECIRLANCETEELFNDQGFDHCRWKYHHSWKRHLPEPLIFLRVLQGLSPIVFWVCFVSTFCGVYATQLQPLGWPNITDHPSFVTPFTLASFALSLLLVFRTNSSYGRWWEARSAIGRQFNWPRIVCRLSMAWVPAEEELIVRAVARWAAVLAPATFAYIQSDPSYYKHAEGLLAPEELQWLKEREQAPFAVLQIMSGLLTKASLDTWQRAQLEQALSEYDLLVGAAERISRTAIPMAYTRMASRYLMLFVTFLPFAFWPLFGWVTIPIMAAFTFLLVGLENIGIQIEQPYSVLPLHAYCMGTRKAVELTVANWKPVAALVESAVVGMPFGVACNGGVGPQGLGGGIGGLQVDGMDRGAAVIVEVR